MIDAVKDDALGTDDVMDILHRLRRRDVSADELARAAEARIEGVNHQLNAVVTKVDLPVADGPFAGIPTAIKDNQDLVAIPHGTGPRLPPTLPNARTCPSSLTSAPWVSLRWSRRRCRNSG